MKMINQMASPSIDRTLKKLLAFRNLRFGWHYGEGKSISTEAFWEAVSCVEFFSHLGFHEMNAFPDPEGGAHLSVYIQDYAIDLHITVEKNFSIVLEKSNEEISSYEGLNRRGMLQSIVEIKQSICSSSASLTQNISISGAIASRARLFKPRQEIGAVALQSSQNAVRSQSVNRYVPTSKATTQSTQPVIRPFSSSSKNLNYQARAA